VTSEPSGAGDRRDAVDLGNGRLSGQGRFESLEWGLCSDAGPVRDRNEDCAAAQSGTSGTFAARHPLFVVADGLGGHDAGEVASRVAVDTMLDSWTTAAGDPAKALRSAVRSANVAVVNEAIRSGHTGMGTTLTALTFSGNDVLIAHVGDSRVYRHRGDSCAQLTTDHSRVGDMLRMKLITVEQAARHPARSQLTRSLGAGMIVQIDLVREQARSGDIFVMCTDGVWDEIGNADMARLLAADDEQRRADAAARLVAVAIDRGAADNVTAVVVSVSSAMTEKPSTDRRSFFKRRT